ncbi:Ger(x)C family spore germination protein [Texcoconibacillus texcoconensis]|uniref:Spore germination protein n=1 Tax=Texcoconibacillus texcoconensis TaxID=1095777 RepID=A0A840QT73_9BACI|nr:Ger(x)C family spore germination protein [Texcoconibacillus texcoconensis]MBB5174508.1 spore germination protein [Texcoconibacillus texcoconensis]
MKSNGQRLIKLSLALLLFITGCGPQQNILDEIRIMHTIGFDYIDDNHFRGTVTIPIYGSETEGETRTEIITDTSRTAKDIKVKLDAQSSKRLHNGKLQSILFDETFLQEGVSELVDTFLRDPKIGMRVQLIGVEDKSVLDLLDQTYPIEEHVARYINDLVDQNIEDQNIPKTNLHIYLARFYDEGADPFIPVVKEKDENLKVNGIMTFNEDRAVCKLSLRESFMMKLLLEELNDGGAIEIALDEDENEFTVLRNIMSEANYTFDFNDPSLSLQIDIDFKARINEYSGQTLSSSKLNEITSATKEQIENEAGALVTQLQENNTDPLAIGMHARSKGYDISNDDWDETYKNLDVNINADVTILSTGIEE